MYWDPPVLTPQQLKRLDKHKYSCQSDSFFDPIMQVWWNRVIEYVPLWMAPNLITVIGLILNVSTAILLIYHCPTAKEPVPQWVTFVCALGLFVYQTLDAIDGKQARRTGTSSPLGELFDHGCDSVSTAFVVVSASGATGMGHMPNMLLLQCLVAFSLFYCAHWQTFVTGTMRFGKFDVTETQHFIMGMMLISSIFGSEVWGTQLFGMVTLRVVPTAIGFVVAFGAIIVTIDTIMAGGAGKNGSTVAGTSVLTPVIPLLQVILPCVGIMVKSSESVFESNPILYVVTFGLISTKVTNKLIVAHMSKSEMTNSDVTLLVPLAFALNLYLGLGIPEHLILKLSLVFVTIDLFMYSKAVCQAICAHMKVDLFRITPKKRPAAN